MQVIQIQFASWDKIYDFNNANGLSLKTGDKVFVETEVGGDVGTVVSIKEINGQGTQEELKPIARFAEANEVREVLNAEAKEEIMQYCRSLVKKHNLPMKIIDVHASYDNSRLKFAFIADGRIDFRELVKDLSRHYQKSIILYQVGIRDEARICGDAGRCGVRPMCCRTFLHELGGINSDMADVQQIAHRGSERLSGICGRLMCCLRFEHEGYAELAKKLPAIGSLVFYEGVEAEVIGWHTLKQSVDLRIKGKGENSGEILFDISVNKLKKT
jgi:cell fate regulator YaaT (PSP1 superfamily)